MFFERVYDRSLAQASYIVGCQAKGVAIVIDPKRDIDDYLAIAERNKLRITHIAETHIHADFLSGARELAAVTGGQLYLSKEGGPDWLYEFPHIGVRHGDVIEVGNLKLEVLHTPGHTPESISFLLTDTPASPEPVMVFTGDFVFVGDIGRPDLLEKVAGMTNTQRAGAQQMHASIQQFAELPDHIQVWPGHGAGSACGKALGAVPSSTVGYEKIRNWAFRHPDNEDAFVENLLSGQPEPPKYFAMMKKLNKTERPLLIEVPAVPLLSTGEFTQFYRNGGLVIDTRNKTAYAQGYLAGSLNIQGNNAFPTWMGWLVDYETPFVLVAEPTNLEGLTRKLMRIGMDDVRGYIASVDSLGIELHQARIVDLDTMKALVGDDNVQLIDVRGQSEYQAGHIPGATHVFVGTLTDNLDKIDKNKATVVYCQSGDRAAIARSVLDKAGHADVRVYFGGMAEWSATGQETTTPRRHTVLSE